MELDHNQSKPIYKQLVDEILKDIREKKLKPNDKLPTERELTERFGVSRGTVKKAYKELADNGVVEMIQGSGTYIYDNTSTISSERRKIAVVLINDLVAKLDKWGFSIQEIYNLVKISLAKKEMEQGRLRIAVIDCNTESLEMFKRQLFYLTDVSISAFLVETILLDDNPQDLLMDYDLILTTVTHYEQISGQIQDLKSRLVRVAMSPSRDTIIHVSRLSPESNIGIFCRTNKFSQIIVDQLQYFLPQLKSITTHFENSFKSPEENAALFRQYDAIILEPDSIVLSQPEMVALLDQYRSDGGKVITFDYVIDNGSLIYIEERIAELLKNENTDAS